ncbi:hypothetical protein [Paraburkholderia phenoliruptrix]|uniref:hypothetical protein n=1 Tax=Paraburkholderia phenoliruptrix TaxID=252970 RepID=UPI0028699F8F|nr:hypothetical protein [Paraburkholderia phenoliruptrix]WMY10956.1 hypothetical protein P3F88_30215 [Paraburkholderia phenoliruptrix]
MTPHNAPVRERVSAAAMAASGLLFVIYPALRPFSDETSLQGGAAFASGEWLAAHMLAMVAFTLIPLGLLGLHSTLRPTPVEHGGYWAVVLSLLGTGLALPFYCGEAYGLHAIGQQALIERNAAIIGLSTVVRSGPGLLTFITGLLLLTTAAMIAAVAIWRSGVYGRWSGVPFAVGLAFYIPQFFGSQSMRVAHGLLVGAGSWWIAAGIWARGTYRFERNLEGLRSIIKSPSQ